MIALFRRGLPVIAVLALCFASSPAAAQWTRVTALPATDMFSVWSTGDTIVAGGDSLVYISTNAGATWKTSVKVAAGVTSVESVRIRNGRLYAGTYGQGVFVSDNLGDSWIPYSQGLAGGIANTHLYIKELLFHGDNLLAATAGAGAWIRNLAVAGTWSHYGNAFESNQASNMNHIASNGTRLLAGGGFNGTLFFRDPGDADWTVSWMNNVGIAVGLAPLSAVWTGDAWVVGGNVGAFLSASGEETWTFVNPGLGTLFNVAFALRGNDLYASFGPSAGSSIQVSHDDGATWEELEMLDFKFIYTMTMNGTTLYASRGDGLWRRSIANVGVPDEQGAGGLRFAIAGPQPVRDAVRFRFELSTPGPASIEVFDVSGRRAARIEGSWSAGSHELSWSARELGPGVYQARLTAGGRQSVLRLVRVP